MPIDWNEFGGIITFYGLIALVIICVVLIILIVSISSKLNYVRAQSAQLRAQVNAQMKALSGELHAAADEINANMNSLSERMESGSGADCARQTAEFMMKIKELEESNRLLSEENLKLLKNSPSPVDEDLKFRAKMFDKICLLVERGADKATILKELQKL